MVQMLQQEIQDRRLLWDEVSIYATKVLERPLRSYLLAARYLLSRTLYHKHIRLPSNKSR